MGQREGVLLPTGHATDTLVLESGRRVTVSLVDAAAPMVFVLAEEMGASATELPQDLDANHALQGLLEDIRAQAAVQLGMAESVAQAREKVKAFPKIAMVAPPTAFRTTRATPIGADQVDLVSRMISMGKTHRTFAGTSSMCLAVAAAIPGTVVHAVTRQALPDRVRIGHPGWHHGSGRQGVPRRRRLACGERYHTAHGAPHYGRLHLRAAELSAGETMVCVGDVRSC